MGVFSARLVALKTCSLILEIPFGARMHDAKGSGTVQHSGGL